MAGFDKAGDAFAHALVGSIENIGRKASARLAEKHDPAIEAAKRARAAASRARAAASARARPPEPPMEHSFAGMDARRERIAQAKIRKTAKSNQRKGALVGTGAGLGVGTVGGASIRRKQQDGDGTSVSKGRLAAVSKNMSMLPTGVRRSQARNTLGQYASHANDLKIVHITPVGAKDGRLVEAHGKSGLAPSMARRPATRSSNSKVPNGCGYGRRLA